MKTAWRGHRKGCPEVTSRLVRQLTVSSLTLLLWTQQGCSAGGGSLLAGLSVDGHADSFRSSSKCLVDRTPTWRLCGWSSKSSNVAATGTKASQRRSTQTGMNLSHVNRCTCWILNLKLMVAGKFVWLGSVHQSNRHAALQLGHYRSDRLGLRDKPVLFRIELRYPILWCVVKAGTDQSATTESQMFPKICFTCACTWNRDCVCTPHRAGVRRRDDQKTCATSRRRLRDSARSPFSSVQAVVNLNGGARCCQRSSKPHIHQ